MSRTKAVPASDTLATIYGKEYALNALERRRKQSQRRAVRCLPYCIACGSSVSTPRGYPDREPDKLCGQCQAMQDLGWLTR